MTEERLKRLERKVKVFTSKDDLTVVVDRLYNTGDKERERSTALFEKYNPVSPPLRRPKAELEANDDRYFKGGFAKKN
jgi:hypothetical protein